MARYAVLDAQGVTTNIIEWNGSDDWWPPADHTVRACPDNVGKGWTWSGEDWEAPPAEPAAEP